MNEIGKKIKQLRRDADLTQEQLVDLLGVAYQTVSKWETGISSPDLSMIAPITRFFKISADELFGLSEGADDARQRELREKWQSTYESGDIIDRYEISKQLTPEEKKRKLYETQKLTLDLFLERGAISRAQYDKSLSDLTEKMGYNEERV